MKKTVIVTFPGNPMPNTDGNLVRIRNMLDFLVDADFEVVFYSYSNSRTWPWSAQGEAHFHASFPDVSLILESWNVGMAFIQRLKNNLSALVPSFTARIVAANVPGLTPKWSRLRAEHPNAIYLLNYAMYATQLNGVDLSRACIETHDLHFRVLALIRGRPIWHWDIMRRMRRELSILDAAGIVLSIARTEHIVFETFLQGPKICYLPPLNTPQSVPEAEPYNSPKTDLLFLGSKNYKNVRGINDFLDRYRTWNNRPTLAIAGTVSSYVEVNDVNKPSVSVLGYVTDLLSLYQSVRAAICPVEGTGVNIKLLEALAYGKPAFASSSAIAALPPGWEGCVFPLTETSIRDVLADANRLRAASAAALKYVDSPYIRGLWSEFRQVLLDLSDRALEVHCQKHGAPRF
jgi:glycosyltransferase involved in cell wall biosynthesis